MRWQYKYMLQRGLSILPMDMGIHLNHFLSVRFGHLRHPQFWGFGNTLGMVSLLERLGFPVEGRRFVELGTGWDGSAVMVLLSLGAESVHSFDLFRHLEQRLLEQVLKEFDDLRPHLSKAFPFEADLAGVAARCRRENIDRARFHYYAPHDACATGLPADSVDLYYSQAVFEHVAQPVILPLHRETLRILKPGGVCFHYVQPTMHAVWMDSRATGIDYLECSDKQWEWLLDNSIAHENRLRGVDHVQLLRDAGFDIVGEWHSIDQKALATLPGRKLAPRFRHYTPEEIATDYIWIVAQKPRSSAPLQ